MKVDIPDGIYAKLEKKIKGSEFGSVPDYVAFVLGEVLAVEEEGSKKLSPEEEKQVKERLKALGYID